MSQLSRVTTWATGQVLTAAALNGEFNNIVTSWNNIDSASSSWTKLSVSGTSTLAGAVSITQNTGNSLVVNSTDLIVDSTNHRIGIGKTPSRFIDTLLTQNADSSFNIQNSSTGASCSISINAINSGNSMSMQMYGTGNTGTLYGLTLANYGVLISSSGAAGMILDTEAGSMYFGTVATKAMQIDTSQNVIIPNTKLSCGGNQVLPILQIVQGTTTQITNTSSVSYGDSNLSVSITPKFNTSKILVFVTGVKNSGDPVLRLNRGATALQDPFDFTQSKGSTSTHYYDSPATTSATTYKVQVKSQAGGGAVFGDNSSVMTITAIEIAQ